MTPIGWKAWDAAGAEYDSRSVSAATLPDTLQFVIAYMAECTASGVRYREVHTGSVRSDVERFYAFQPCGRIRDFEGSQADAEVLFPDAVLRRGSLIDDASYAAIADRAYAAQWEPTDTVAATAIATTESEASPIAGCCE